MPQIDTHRWKWITDAEKARGKEMFNRALMGIVPPATQAEYQIMKSDPWKYVTEKVKEPPTQEAQKEAIRELSSRSGGFRGAGGPSIIQSLAGAMPIAFHGSPHKFEKFDISKVGTGQGAQIYGHGLYFAENPQVAQTYKLAGEPAWRGPTTYGHVQTALQRAKIEGLSGENAKTYAINSLNNMAKNAPEGVRQQFYDAINNFDELAASKGYGQMYKVNIPDEHVAKMLDWDAGLSEQPEAIKSLLKERFPNGWVGPKNPTGEQIYRELLGGGGDRVTASNDLKAAGVPGIKYLDQGSRQAGKGTRNFVVFDPDILEMLK